MYGTLRDAEFQRALFDHALPARPATLPGWVAVVAESGYLTVVRAPGESVRGDLIELDDAELAVADGWEEVPLYERLRLEARCSDGDPVECWVYVRSTASRERPARGALARHDRARVIADIRAFRAGAGGTFGSGPDE